MNMLRYFTLSTLVVLLCGCGALCPMCLAPSSHTGGSTSLVEFLYPKGTPPATTPAHLPVLPVPLRVGLSFLPTREGTEAPDLAQREQIMDRVAEHFRSRGFISQIVIIPDYYLQGVHGFDGLAGVERLYGTDVMALISYDQVGYQDESRTSLGYLTIVGAYVLPGTHQDVTTLVDLAVVDANSRTLILRAGGVDTRAHNTTLVGSQTAAREQQRDSLNAASNQLIQNFDVALTQLQADIKAGRSDVQVTQRGGSGGGGAFGGLWLGGLAFLALLQALRRARVSA